MPSKIDNVKLPREHDRRYKLSEDDYEMIRTLYAQGKTIAELTQLYSVCRSTFYNVLFSYYHNRALAYSREYEKTRSRRSKEYFSTYQRQLRARKKEIFND